MKDTTRNAIIDDLLRKRPKGPKGVKLVYSESREYNYDRGRYVHFSVPSDQRYGYSSETLFSLGLHSAHAVTAYVRDRWFSGKSNWEIGRKKSTITRRTNRLWDRLGGVIQQMKREGGRGIYGVYRRHHGDAIGYVFGNTPEEVIAIATTFFPHTDEDYRAEFKELGGVEKLREYNQQIQNRLGCKVNDYKKAIADSEKRIVAAENRMAMLNVLAGHQVAIETEV